MFIRILFIGALSGVFAVCGVFYALAPVFGELQPGTVNRKTLVFILVLRDLRQDPKETLVRFVQRLEQEFGTCAVQKPAFEYGYAEKQIYLYFQTHRSTKKTIAENNLTALAKIQYFAWMDEYESAARNRQAAVMKRYVAELKYWQTVYIDYLASLGLPPPALAELYREFQETINEFLIGETEETQQRIKKFTKELGRYFLVDGVRGAVEKTFPAKLFR